ncbi:hypothetical protein BGZ67_006939 [Mortierella alpina]|nr:hypothetical protein BGZ67_006939 [Mortierella alpina]
MLLKSKSAVSTSTVAVIASLMMAVQVHAGDLVWSQMNFEQSYAVGTQVVAMNGATVVGLPMCVIASLGLVATAGAAVACALTGPGEATCAASGAWGWLAASWMALIQVATYECNEVGQDFTGHMFAERCWAAEYIVHHRPPSVPTSVSSFYRKQCSDTCTNPRRCNVRAKVPKGKENMTDVD